MKKKNDYWEVRSRILRAVASGDEEAVNSYATSHPELFKQLVTQAKNSRFKTERKAWRTK